MYRDLTLLLQLRLKDSQHGADNVVDLGRLALRLRHSGELAEAADDRFQIADFGQQRRGSLVEDLLEQFGSFLLCADQVLDRDLQREQRVLQFVRQTARQFPPRSHALGLHGALFLLEQVFGHAIERGSEFAQFVARLDIDLRGEISGSDSPGCLGQGFDGARDARGKPQAGQHRDQDAGAAHQQTRLRRRVAAIRSGDAASYRPAARPSAADWGRSAGSRGNFPRRRNRRSSESRPGIPVPSGGPVRPGAQSCRRRRQGRSGRAEISDSRLLPGSDKAALAFRRGCRASKGIPGRAVRRQ